jgi:hypothetical protein
MELYLHIPIRFYNVVFETENSLAFTFHQRAVEAKKEMAMKQRRASGNIKRRLRTSRENS